ncbi:thiamine diphosphokinase [Ornithinibacillus sp. L9]|uniref:Thiamine diphosphokinase n=1 Tax=Ornithinibacillus caprae TaxID=2678566 RepID=A0A6N8FPQ9_9BACI|nr:thiamine diphosphokinase [Ornithinibacillus caprae]MUK89478.1 thiamine diphosphokinase [Ornithinibacillus caprae]
MTIVGIVGSGPTDILPKFVEYQSKVDYWIGADRGAYTLLENNINIDFAIGDFDSITMDEKEKIRRAASNFKEFTAEKDETDIELALLQAYELKPTKIMLFAVTGGRLDHTLANIQLLMSIKNRKIDAVIIDQQNQVELTLPGKYVVEKDDEYPNISFLPITDRVKGLTLTGFYYPLTDETIFFGSTRCISNKLLLNNGTFSYSEGILLFIKSRDLT